MFIGFLFWMSGSFFFRTEQGKYAGCPLDLGDGDTAAMLLPGVIQAGELAPGICHFPNFTALELHSGFGQQQIDAACAGADAFAKFCRGEILIFLVFGLNVRMAVAFMVSWFMLMPLRFVLLRLSLRGLLHGWPYCGRFVRRVRGHSGLNARGLRFPFSAGERF